MARKKSRRAARGFEEARRRIAACADAGESALDLSSLGLTALPPEITSLTALTTLHLDNNQLSALPPEIASLTALTLLSISHNQLSVLPPEMAQLAENAGVQLDGNPWAEPLPELIERGWPAVRAYLAGLRVEGEAQFEAKLMLVGEGNVGKSSLIDRLIHGSFEKDRDTTHGIELGRLVVPHPEYEDTDIILNSWDFGGQEVYRITHQFFSRRARSTCWYGARARNRKRTRWRVGCDAFGCALAKACG